MNMAHKAFDLRQDPLLGLIGVFFSTSNFDTTFLMRDFPFLSILFFFIHLIKNINLDTQLITELVDANALRTNDTTNILLVYFKFS